MLVSTHTRARSFMRYSGIVDFCRTHESSKLYFFIIFEKLCAKDGGWAEKNPKFISNWRSAEKGKKYREPYTHTVH